ncbi:unnamed protein product, partial [Owenia fusiformis]
KMAPTTLTLILFMLAAVAAKDTYTETCYTGDFLLVRKSNDPSFESEKKAPNCDLLLGYYSQAASVSINQCFKRSCMVMDANVIYFDELHKRCDIYRCESKVDGSDWDYNWGRNPMLYDVGKTFARPHPSTPKCHNSFFVRRTWHESNNFKSNCASMMIEQQTVNNVQSLRECMDKACKDNANVFNFYLSDNNEYICETKHCKWITASNDYNFNMITDDNNKGGPKYVYSLSHTAKPFHTFKQSVQISIYGEPQPTACVEEGHMYFKDKNEHVLNSLYDNGYNSFQQIETGYLAFKCSSNEEGTGFKYYYTTKCHYKDEDQTEWWNAIYPGTPNCGSDIFTLRSIGALCQKAECGQSLTFNAVDLRQCMLYACNEKFNVINYFSNTTTVVCDIRNCDESENGNYELNLKKDAEHAYDIYVLAPDPTKLMVTQPKYDQTSFSTIASPTSTKLDITMESETPATTKSETIIKDCIVQNVIVFVLVIFNIASISFLIYCLTKVDSKKQN